MDIYMQIYAYIKINKTEININLFFTSHKNQVGFVLVGSSAPHSDLGTQTLSTAFPHPSNSSFPHYWGPPNSLLEAFRAVSTQGKRENVEDSMGGFDGPGLEMA